MGIQYTVFLLFLLTVFKTVSLQPPGVPPKQQFQQQPQYQQQQQQQYQQQQYQQPPQQQYQQPPQQQYQQPPQQQYQQPPQQQYQQPPQQQYQQPPQQQQYQQPPQQQQQYQQQQPPVQQHQQEHGHGDALKFKADVHNAEHVMEHLQDVIDTKPKDQMTEEELEFHYFKMHDYDSNNKLDGVEIGKALTHFHAEANAEANADAPPPKVFTDDEIANIVDSVLKENDLSQDGYIEYAEFKAAQQAVRSDNNEEKKV